MRSLADPNNNNSIRTYGSTVSNGGEQEVDWNEDDGAAALLNNSSDERNSSIRQSFLMHVGNMNHMRESLRNSTGNLMRQSVTLSFGGRQCSVRASGGTATIPTEFFNLVKNLVGAGMLAIPSGVAAFADAPSALLPGAFFTFLIGAIFGYYFLLIGRTCHLTDTATYREVWEHTMGESQALATMVSLVNTTKPALGNLAYSMILADTLRSLFASVQVDFSRTSSLLLITTGGLLPLCLLKNLSVLGPTSMLGVFGFAATTIVMGYGILMEAMRRVESLRRIWRKSINLSLETWVQALLGPTLKYWCLCVCFSRHLWRTTTLHVFTQN